MKKQVSPKIVSLAFGVLVISFMVAFYVFAWTEPISPPPAGNVPAPLNTGSHGQEKIGGLVLNTGGAPTGLIVDQGNVGIGTEDPNHKLDVSGEIHATGDICTEAGAGGTVCLSTSGGGSILIAGTIEIFADAADPDAGISDPIDVSSFSFNSPDEYQVILTPQTPIGDTPGAPANQHPCFSEISDINGGCFGPLWLPVIANKTATSFRIMVHDNEDNDFPGLIVPVDYIVVRY